MLLRFAVYKLPALAYMAFIFYMSSGPITSASLNSVPDYFLHSTGYAALYVAVFWAVHEGLQPGRGRGGFLLPAVITVLYGISDEFHQSFIPTREAGVRDVLADTAGAVVGMAVVALTLRLRRQFRANRQL